MKSGDEREGATLVKKVFWGWGRTAVDQYNVYTEVKNGFV